MYFDAILDLDMIQSSHLSKACHSQLTLYKYRIMGAVTSRRWLLSR